MKRVVLIEKCPNGTITKENWFIDLIHDIQITTTPTFLKTKNYRNNLFFVKNGLYLFEKDLNDKMFWCCYDLCWHILREIYKLSYAQTRIFMKHMIKKHFNIMEYTPENISIIQPIN